MKASRYLFRYAFIRDRFNFGVLRKNISDINKNRKLCFYITDFKTLTTVSRVEGLRKYEEEYSSYDVQYPKHFNFASDVLDKWALKEKENKKSDLNPALWYVFDDGNEVKFTFQELEDASKRIARFLQEQCGIKRGDNVIVMLPKIPEFWLINIAAIRIGFVLSPATMMLREKDLIYRCSALKPVCIIAHHTVADIVDNVFSSCSTVKERVIVSPSYTKRDGWKDFNRWKEVKGADHQCAVTRSDETMMVFFTSGTTGNPKMVEQTHASYGIGLHDVGKYWLDMNSGNILWNMSDTGWAKTAYSSIFAPWSRGGCVFIHQMLKFDPIKMLQILCKYPIDTLCAPPLAFRALVQEDLSLYKFKKLEHCVSGGETSNFEVIKKWNTTTGIKLYELYGQTENAGLIGMQKTFEYRMGSIGKPLPGRSVKIVDENENEVGPNTTGEIVSERKNTIGLFKGYKDNPEENKAKLTEKYHHSGDLAYCDEDGYFWFVGRNDDLVNSAGYRIGPAEVENALMEHPAVAEVAVVSSPDSKRGEVVKAFIILQKNATPSAGLITELQDHCKKVTAPYKYPRKIEFVKEFPKTHSGKIKRSELKQKEWQSR